MANKFDDVFMSILREQQQVIPFLESVFGFLYRCTDFYQIQDNPNVRFGFPPGIAEKIVIQEYKKWERLAQRDRGCIVEEICDAPAVLEEVIVTNSENKPEPENSSPLKESQNENLLSCGNNKESTETKRVQAQTDSYNGAVRDRYSWSQSILDLDVQVPVKPHVLKGKQVKVKIFTNKLFVSLQNADGSENILLDEELCWPVNKEESIWSLVPGQYIQIHLDKSQERWWEALLRNEAKIDLKNIDASRPMDDLSQEEQMKIQELMWNQERKRLGLPTSDQLNMEKILKDAWNKEGSPFRDRPYNPQDFTFSNGALDIKNIEESS